MFKNQYLEDFNYKVSIIIKYDILMTQFISDFKVMRQILTLSSKKLNSIKNKTLRNQFHVRHTIEYDRFHRKLLYIVNHIVHLGFWFQYPRNMKNVHIAPFPPLWNFKRDNVTIHPLLASESLFWIAPPRHQPQISQYYYWNIITTTNTMYLFWDNF